MSVKQLFHVHKMKVSTQLVTLHVLKQKSNQHQTAATSNSCNIKQLQH